MFTQATIVSSFASVERLDVIAFRAPVIVMVNRTRGGLHRVKR